MPPPPCEFLLPPTGRRPRRFAPAGAPTTPKPLARRRARSCSASPARVLARGRLRGEEGVVVMVLLAPHVGFRARASNGQNETWLAPALKND